MMIGIAINKTAQLVLAAAGGVGLGVATPWAYRKLDRYLAVRPIKKLAAIYDAKGERGLRVHLYDRGVAMSEEHMNYLMSHLVPQIDEYLSRQQEKGARKARDSQQSQAAAQ